MEDNVIKIEKFFKYNLAVKKLLVECRPPSEAALEVNSLISKVSMDCDMVFGDDYFAKENDNFKENKAIF